MTAFGLENEVFVVHIVFFASSNNIHLSHKLQIASLKADEAPTTILLAYSNFANIFSLKLVAELLEHMWINNHIIDLIDGK